MNVLKPLRVFFIVLVILLALQFELGMAVNLSPTLQDIPPLAGSISAMMTALSKVGVEAFVHAVLGTALVAAGLVGLVLSILSGSRIIVAMGIGSFLFLALAELSGILFTLSGFKDDGDSHGMATGFLLAFSFSFIQVCVASVKLRRRREP